VIAALTGDGMHNAGVLQAALDSGAPVTVPPGSWPIGGALVLRDGATLAGPGAMLRRIKLGPEPFLHIQGSRVTIRDLVLEVPATGSGTHEGDSRTAITIGRYLYPGPATWISGITVAGVRIRRTARCAANSIAVMGAVRDVSLVDVDISGGGTGVAVHWGAVADSVSTIVGPSYHPHHLEITGLRVAHAFEGFYLSSVHDVEVSGVTCDDVEIGCRLLAGDNGIRYHHDPVASRVSSHLRIRDLDVTWHGLYGIRVAGWGRSEVDREITKLDYRDVTISDCELRLAGESGRARAAVVLEHAAGVTITDVRSTGDVPELLIDGAVGSLARGFTSGDIESHM
jgi:hypothetical protein